MRDLNTLRIQQLEELVTPMRQMLDSRRPSGGWVRATREALGLTNVQLAKRMGRKAPQTIEAMQRSEVLGTIQLSTLRELAEAMNCRLVYALVPEKPLDEIRRDRAKEVASAILQPALHSMKLETQGVGVEEERRALERQVEKLLAGSSRRLWE